MIRAETDSVSAFFYLYPMSFTDKYTKVFRALLPAPFTIAVALTFVTYFIALTWNVEMPKTEISVQEKKEGYLLTSKKGNEFEWQLIGEEEEKIVNDTLYLEYTTELVSLNASSKNADNGYVGNVQFDITYEDGEIVELIPNDVSKNKPSQILNFWYNGLWGEKGLAFAIQMMLMLLLGHVLALSKPVDSFLNKITPLCNNTANAAMYVTLFTVIVSLFNWGLGLIFGAVFARKVGEFALQTGREINYALVGAAGYSGLMVWHGGVSGSSLIKVAEPGHLEGLVNNKEVLDKLPDVIPYTETVFSSMNITVSVLLILLLPLCMFFLGKRIKPTKMSAMSKMSLTTSDEGGGLVGAEKLDHSKVVAYVFGGVILLYALYLAYSHPEFSKLKFINPNFINFSLFGLAIVLHGNFYKFLNGVEKAISGTSGILIQFPLYFGIMGIMKNSGLIGDIALFFSGVSNETTYPILTFFSAGLVNVFVPSGGGQWYVQGPIVLETAVNMGMSVPKSIMALAYGDQITNMLQPFWALPLLGITGLKAKQILPYTLFLMVIGSIIFISGLLIF